MLLLLVFIAGKHMQIYIYILDTLSLQVTNAWGKSQGSSQLMCTLTRLLNKSKFSLRAEWRTLCRSTEKQPRWRIKDSVRLFPVPGRWKHRLRRRLWIHRRKWLSWLISDGNQTTGDRWILKFKNTKSFFRVHELDICYIPKHFSPWEAHSVHVRSRPSTQASRRLPVQNELWQLRFGRILKSNCLASGGTLVVIVWGLFWLDKLDANRFRRRQLPRIYLAGISRLYWTPIRKPTFLVAPRKTP